MLKMNNKAQVGESMLWLYRSIVIIIIIGGIIFVVVRYYSSQQDVRPLEASLLANKILNCLAPETSSKFNYETINNCIATDNEVFINLTFENKNLSLGNDLLATLCQAKKIKGKNLPYCFEDTFLLLDKGQEKNLTIEIAIRKIEKNV